MDIVFHAHHAKISDHMRERAVRAVRRAARRAGSTVSAVVRFEEDGPMRCVELVLHAPRSRRLVAKAAGRYFGPALATASAKLVRLAASGGVR